MIKYTLEQSISEQYEHYIEKTLIHI